VKKARADGNKQLAKELGQFRKPTQSAWLVNQLWRDQQDVMEQLFELANDLSGAQARASGAELRTLTTQRRAIEAALMSRAREIAREAGVNVSTEMEREVQETLSAALAQREAADEVRTGRLVKPIEYAGFGMLALGASAAPPQERKPGKEPTPIRRREGPKEDDEQERKRRAAREKLEQAQQAAVEALGTLEAAKRDVAEQDKRAKTTQQQLEEVRQELERLRKRERDLEDESSAAERATREAARQHDRAQREHEDAVRALDQAEQEMKKL
jgi:hypothetical protein